MKTSLLKIVLCAACALTATLTSNAGPLRRADIGADALWVAHLDVDGMRPTAVGQFIQSEMEKPEAQAKLAAFQALFSFDLRTQIHAVSLYGISKAPEDGLLILYADFNPERLVTLARAAKDARNSSHGQHTIYSWLDEKKHKHGTAQRVYAAIAGSRVIFGQSENRVAQALDIVDGASASLATSAAFSPLGTPGDSSFLEAAARKLNLPGSDPHAAILKLSQSVHLQVAEAQKQLTATLTLQANDEEVAGHINSIAQGLVALMKLQKDKPESIRFAEALSLRQDGSQVVASLVLPDNDALAMIKADAARKAQRKAEKAERE
jgi:hypothetical protein